MATGPGCLVEEDLLRLVGQEGDFSDERRCYDHLDRCDRCRSVLAEVLRASGERHESGERRAAFAFSAGDLIAGRYEIRGLLGRGGMGEVYSAHDRLLNQIIALKTIAYALTGDAKVAQRLKTEVSLARRATHANVCRLFDAGTHEWQGSTVLFITMELLEGRTLRAHLQDGALSQPEILQIATQVATGLGATHSVGVVHRDLKPENVMIVRDGPEETMRAVLMDFGLARPAWNDAHQIPVTSLQGIIGTPAYMAPEQLAGRPPTIQTDIYSFGVLLSELLAHRSLGSSAQEGGSPGATWWPRRKGSVTIRRLHAIADRCLQRRPSDRFQEMREVEQVIRNVQRRWRRMPGPTTTAALAILVALAGGLAWRQMGPRLPPARSPTFAEPAGSGPTGSPRHLDGDVTARTAVARREDAAQPPREQAAPAVPSPARILRAASGHHRGKPSAAKPDGSVEVTESVPAATPPQSGAVTAPASNKPILDRSNPYQ